MSVVFRRPMSLSEFLAWEERWEFDGVQSVAMTGSTFAHETIGATFARNGNVWTAEAIIEGDILKMPEIGIEVALAEIYADIDFPSSEDEIPAER